MWFRRACSVMAWNGLLLVVGLLVIEAIFGGWLSPGGFGALHIPRNVTLRHDVTNQGRPTGIAIYRRDQWGLRGAFETPDRIDVLAVGGSTTNELYVDDRLTWTAVLQQQFAAAGKKVVVANAGIDGHSTVGHLNSFDLWFPRVPGLKPKFVLFYVGINDVQVEEHVRYDVIVPKGVWQKFRRTVSNESALNSAFRTLRGMLRAKRARLIYLDNPPVVAPIDANPSLDKSAYDVRITQYAARLKLLAAKVAAMGARPIFVTQRRGDAFTIAGRNHATNSTALVNRQIQNLFNATTMRVCRAVQAICIDLAGEIKLSTKDFTDPIHTNISGSRKIGEYLYGRLKSLFPE
jgi:lysophospholipase L1-like esterase